MFLNWQCELVKNSSIKLLIVIFYRTFCNNIKNVFTFTILTNKS
jgi:hypothetical protein